MAHSDGSPTLSALLVIAPTGAYTGRVKTGIDIVLGSEKAVEETKIRVVLVAGKEWLEDEAYKRDFVDPLKNHVLEVWKQTGKLDVECDVVDLPMLNEEHLMAWLLAELCSFLGSSKGPVEAFVDLTAGPKEWQFAAMNVSNFFENLELYYVRPGSPKKLTEYDPREKDDLGFPKLENVRAGEPRPPLLLWMQPKDVSGKLNPHYLLFETIFEMAKEESQAKIKALDQVWVPILERNGLDAYRQRLPRELKTKLSDNAGLMRHVSKLLSGVDPFRLFERTPKSVRMTLRATALAQGLFKKK